MQYAENKASAAAVMLDNPVTSDKTPIEIRFTDLNEALSWLDDTVSAAEHALKIYVEPSVVKENPGGTTQEVGRSVLETQLIKLVDRVHLIRDRLGNLVGRVVG